MRCTLVVGSPHAGARFCCGDAAPPWGAIEGGDVEGWLAVSNSNVGARCCVAACDGALLLGEDSSLNRLDSTELLSLLGENC